MTTPITLKKLKDALTRINAPLFKGEYNLNLVGIRSADAQANTFNDTLCVLFETGGQTVLMQFAITTDPGLYYRENPVNVKGSAILKPGHYPKCWAIGLHRGKYPALVQRGSVTVYRDADKDESLDIDGQTESGWFGINLHHAEPDGYTLQVDKWSAGCQVFADLADFNLVMALAAKSAKLYGNAFSYTLLSEADL